MHLAVPEIVQNGWMGTVYWSPLPSPKLRTLIIAPCVAGDKSSRGSEPPGGVALTVGDLEVLHAGNQWALQHLCWNLRKNGACTQNTGTNIYSVHLGNLHTCKVYLRSILKYYRAHCYSLCPVHTLQTYAQYVVYRQCYAHR